MKQKRFLLLIGSIIIVGFSCSKKASEPDCIPYPVPQDSYNYPIKPGTAEWIALSTTDARVKACQIPNTVLSGMSTSALIQSWLDFPFNSDVFLSSSLQIGMQYWLANFSGLVELQKRADAGKKIIERYITMNPSCITNQTTDTAKGYFTMDFIYIQLLLSQDIFLNNLGESDKKTIVSEALKKYFTEKIFTEYYAQVGFGSCLCVCAKTMLNANYQPFITVFNNSPVLKQFINIGKFPNGIIDSQADIQLLIKLSSDYSK